MCLIPRPWPDHQPGDAAWHTHVDCHLATCVLPDAFRRKTTNAANHHASIGGLGTKMTGAFGSGDVLTTSGDDKHRKPDVFIKKT